MGALVAATTHYAELKVYAMTTPGVENASCEFNVDSLAPTYRLLIGIPGKSNAFAISERLGLPKEIIQKAAARIDAENVRFEDVLTQLDEQRHQMDREYKAQLEAQRAKAVEKAQAEARAILDEARDTAEQTFRELNEMRRRQRKEEDWQRVNDERSALLHSLNQAEGKLGTRPQEPAPPPTRPARAGDTVELVKMGTQATVLSVNKDGSLQLQAGILKISAKQDEVRVVEGETQKAAKKVVQRAEHKLRAMGASPEVDLRGMTAGQAQRGAHHPRQGHRRGAPRGAGAPEAQPLYQILPPRPLRRGGRWRDHRRAAIGQPPSHAGTRGGLRGESIPPGRRGSERSDRLSAESLRAVRMV